MSDSLLEEIMEQEEIIHARIAAGKNKIRRRQEKQQHQLESKYEHLIKQLHESELIDKEKEFHQYAQACSELERSCDETINRESTLPEETIHRLLKELLYKGLQKDSHDHQDDES